MLYAIVRKWCYAFLYTAPFRNNIKKNVDDPGPQYFYRMFLLNRGRESGGGDDELKRTKSLFVFFDFPKVPC